MAHRKRKKYSGSRHDLLTEEQGGDISSWTDNTDLKITPFSDLEHMLRRSGTEVPGEKKDLSRCADHVSRGKKGGELSPSCLNSPVKQHAPHACTHIIPEDDTVNDASSDISAEPDDNTLFLHAMEGVAPLQSRENYVESADMTGKEHDAGIRMESEDAVCTGELNALVSGKKEIPVEYTPEYVEGPAINNNPRIVRKLRRGKFSVQAYCDLHGLTAKEALDWCEEFMAGSIAANRSCIAFIHGRGLSSVRRPVLKKMVHDWLQTGKWRRHVIAFSSAPNWDGGPGVTYVLLGKKPRPRPRRPRRRLWA